jgi:membrane fusion protein (multidrug efflux system)
MAAASVDVVISQAQAQTQAPTLPTVVVQPAQKREIARRSEFVGKIQAVEKVDVRVRVTGTLLAPKFKDGQPVETGQLLYEIDPAPFQADVDAKRAQLASMKAQAQNAQVSFDRASDLLRTNAGSQAVYDQRKAELDQANAAVQMAQAALENSDITLGYTKISSPISGRIGRTAITQGNIVSPSSGALTTIVKDDRVYAVFTVSQREVLEYSKRATTVPPVVKLLLADGSTYDKTAQIDYIDNTVDATTNSQILRATFDNPNLMLVNDQTIRVIIEEPAEKPDIVVPQAVLSADQTGTFVMIVDGEGKVAVRYVKTGPAHGGDVAVISGLQEGDLVITLGAQRVRPGMKVDAQKQEAANPGEAKQDKTGK